MNETLLIASIFFLTVGYMFGYYLRDARDRAVELKNKITAEPKESIEPASYILEPPLSPAERVARDQEELLERLNPS